MKKTVLLVFLLICVIPSAFAYQIASVPESFTITMSLNECRVETLSMVTSDGHPATFSFQVSERLEPYVSLGKLDDTHFTVSFHPTEEIVGQTINGVIYVTAEGTQNAITAPFSKVTFPVELTLTTTEALEPFDRTCPTIGEPLEVVPLSLDAVSLLVLVMIALGVLNFSARVRMKKRK